MLTTSRTSDSTQKSLKISTHPKDDKNFFSNINNFSSSEEYYHGSGSSASVPFMWESQPGTPKVKLRESPNLPPLTPPPSYYPYSPVTKGSSPTNKTRKSSIIPKANLLRNIFFPKQYAGGAGRKRFPSSPPLSPSSRSSLESNFSPRSTLYSSVPTSPVVRKTPTLKSRGRRRNIISSPWLSVDSRVDDGDHEDEDQEYGSPVSTLCFGRGVANPKSRSGCYSSLIKVLLN